MPSLALYGAVYSTCTQRVLIVLNELGLSYEMKNVDLMKGAHKVCLHGLAIASGKTLMNQGPKLYCAQTSLCPGASFGRRGPDDIRIEGHLQVPPVQVCRRWE